MPAWSLRGRRKPDSARTLDSSDEVEVGRRHSAGGGAGSLGAACPALRASYLRLEAGRQHIRPRPLALGGTFVNPHPGYLLGAGVALGGVPQTVEAPSLDAESAVRHRGGLYGHHSLRAPRRVRAALPDRPQGTG